MRLVSDGPSSEAQVQAEQPAKAKGEERHRCERQQEAGGHCVLAFFLFLYLTGHDPDESPLTLIEWVIAGVLIGLGFGYLVRWRQTKDR
ncbi:hypothetical protein ASG58_20235 [Rhizobium sp. Leaf383]|nr:hypothetical protein ASG58_20235 [Rhizobium sp. Leaf383]